MSMDLSGNSNNPYEWSFFARDYTPDPMAINLTTGHTMLTFDSQKMKEYLEAKRPHTADFIEGQIYMLSKFSSFFNAIYEKGYQPHPKFLLKAMEFLSAELEFRRAEVDTSK
jgi:hypothetical protein